MTDEEKAIKDICIKCSSYDFCVKGNQLHCAETVAYIKGLTEGRKEGYEAGILKDCLKVACPNCKPSVDNYCIDCEYANFIIDKDNQIYKLEKENEQLKCDLYNTDANLQHITIEYEKENTELNRDKTELEAQLKNNPYVQILQNEKSEMAEDFAKQIEKMKNKLNCSKYHYIPCKDKSCKDCKDWKMND